MLFWICLFSSSICDYVAGLKLVQDIVLRPQPDLARQLKLPLDDVLAMLNAVSRELNEKPRRVSEVVASRKTRFTTGDSLLDQLIGGGMRTEMIWEFCGERYVCFCSFIRQSNIHSAAGKTQLALQLALAIQLPELHGGLDGSCCFITTRAQLPTKRLEQILREHPQLSGRQVGLSDIHTIHTATLPALVQVLTYALPRLIQQLGNAPTSRRPIRLLVIDSIYALFHAEGKTDTKSLGQRSKYLTDIAGRLRSIAMRYNVAVVIINDVLDTFSQSAIDERPDQLTYAHQIQWISRASTILGEDRKEAALGLVWSNQINVRVMLSRTGRRRMVDEVEQGRAAKRRKFSHLIYEDIHQDLEGTTVLRRMSVIFCPVAPPASLDFIITSAGLEGIALDDSHLHQARAPQELVASSSGTQNPQSNDDATADEDEELWKEFGDIDEDHIQEAERIEKASQSRSPEEEDEALWDTMPDLSEFVTSEELSGSQRDLQVSNNYIARGI